MKNNGAKQMDESTILKIARYKCQLAELNRQWMFENLEDKFYQINYDRIEAELERLEND
tara:strand:+ start:640 stop:816 length:177 start_codon:yes stop_codon:yes gene_type:complete